MNNILQNSWKLLQLKKLSNGHVTLFSFKMRTKLRRLNVTSNLHNLPHMNKSYFSRNTCGFMWPNFPSLRLKNSQIFTKGPKSRRLLAQAHSVTPHSISHEQLSIIKLSANSLRAAGDRTLSSSPPLASYPHNLSGRGNFGPTPPSHS